MATYTKFNDYVDQLNRAVHNWASHTFTVALCLTAPIASNAALGDLTQIAGGGGYTAGAGGGYTLDTVTLSEASGVAKVTVADEVITATGAALAPFRYLPIYNDSATSPADALVAFYDYGSSLTLAETETLTVDFDPTDGLWEMA